MIATILPGSSDFHAVGYNERKVSKGQARLIEMQNIFTAGATESMTSEEKVKYLQEYSARNGRIQKPQFHVAISCKGHEMKEEQLLDFAHKYLKEMGYGEPGQPLLVYSHYDTENTHLHIVTSRIAPDGRKIDHHHERRRSQEVIDKILGNDRKAKVDADLEAAKQYTFSSFAQFKAVLTSMGYEAFEKNGTVYIKYGGKVQKQVQLSEITALYNKGTRDRERNRQLRSILKKYRDVCTDKEELQKEMKTKFGIDIVFFGRKDKPYGYMLVDHANKTVIHGARVLAMEELLDFATPEERFNRVEAFIDQLFDINPKITQRQINEKIFKQHAYIKRGFIYFNGRKQPLQPFMAEAINRNNRIALVKQFYPATDADRDILCRIFKVSRPDLVDLSADRPQSHRDAVSRLHEIFADETATDIRASLRNEVFILYNEEDATFAIDFKRHIIINLTEEDFNLSRLKTQPSKRKSKQTRKTNNSVVRKPKFHDTGDGSRGEKREWEVGHNGYGDVDDGRSLKR